MMKKVLVIFLFYAIPAFSQYAQFIKPTRAQEILSLTQYHFRQEMIQLFKSSSHLQRVSSTQLRLQPAISCAEASELVVARVNLPRGLRESLYLKNCSRRFELFTVERVGSEVFPTSDDDLLRGVIPEASQNLETYRLDLIERSVQFAISQKNGEQKLDFLLFSRSGRTSIKMEILEKTPDKILNYQFTRLGYYESDRLLDESSTEYIWSFDPKYAVPRQYLYVNQKEVPPNEFLKKKNFFYDQMVFPWLQQSLEFAQGLF